LRELDEFGEEEEEEDEFDLYGDLDDNYGKSGRGQRSPTGDFLPDDTSYRKSSGQTPRGSTSSHSKQKSNQRKEEQTG
jgi:hypothetical protein